jgi:hypothetical protein
VLSGIVTAAAVAQESASPTVPAPLAPMTQAPSAAAQADRPAPTLDQLRRSARSRSRSGAFTGNIAAAGTGATAAANQLFPNALVLPGLLTASQSESAIPTTRVTVGYSFYYSFQVVSTPIDLNQTATVRGAGFDLHRYQVSVERTIMDDRASFYVNVPFLDAVSNVTNQPIDGFGNISAGFKAILAGDPECDGLLTAGLTVSAPTGRDAVFATAGNLVAGVFVPTDTVRINPTYIQPWLAARRNFDRLFVENYTGVLVPTDDAVATFINNNLTVGYELLDRNEDDCEDRMISSITPLVSLQALIPVSKRGSERLPFGYPDQFFLSSGAAIGLGEKTVLTATVVTPVSGPKGFDVGFNIGLTFLR